MASSQRHGPPSPADVDPATADVPVGGYVCSPKPVTFHESCR